jgi:uncharacterized protein (DUF1015 family)
MSDIRPFSAIFYNVQKVGNIAEVVAEPYDVITPAQQRAYYRMHPYNIIRLILGRSYASDNKKNNQYTRAGRFFVKWLRKNILYSDKREYIYIYTQTFRHNGRVRVRTGFIALLKLEDFAQNSILPHENTFSQSVQDRLKLLQSVHANLSPIFALFCDPQRKIHSLLSAYKRKHSPCIVLKKDDITHRIWRMSDEKKIGKIQELVKRQQIFIADGHHRYEAALKYRRYRQGKKKDLSKLQSFDYIMAYLVATSDPGLAILPTHRVVRIKDTLQLSKIVSSLQDIFFMRKISTARQLFSYLRKKDSAYVYGAYFGRNRFWIIRIKKKGRQSTCENSDVTILHEQIINRILNLNTFAENIYYTRDAQEAIELVDKDKYQAAFFLRPATVAQVKRFACAGIKMPHKSTYFYPKLLTGLVINKFDIKSQTY